MKNMTHLIATFSLASAALLARPCAAAPGAWIFTGSLNTGRSGQTATLLQDGRVLVVGGFGGGGSLASAELYDPATGTWTQTGSVTTPRLFHTATLLPNGMVLVVGGQGANLEHLKTTELYDPATGTWSFTGSLTTGRYNHSATLLPNGSVLVAAGVSNTGANNTAELYNPATGIWSPTGNLNAVRVFHTANLLQNGQVLVACGYTNNSALATAELYNPATGTWATTGSLTTPRYRHTSTILNDGRVLVAGGVGDGGNRASAELYDPATGTWSVTGSLGNARQGHTATLLPDGQVLVAGGTQSLVTLTSAELYDPAAGTWSPTGSLNIGRGGHTATLLPDGAVLAAGGQNNGDLASAELYGPGTVPLTHTNGQGLFDRDGNTVEFRFRASEETLGQFTLNDAAAGLQLTNGRIETVAVTGNTAEFTGTARLSGGQGRVTFDVTVTDNGSGGTSDTIAVTLSNGYSASGTLTSGEIRRSLRLSDHVALNRTRTSAAKFFCLVRGVAHILAKICGGQAQATAGSPGRYCDHVRLNFAVDFRVTEARGDRFCGEIGCFAEPRRIALFDFAPQRRSLTVGDRRRARRVCAATHRKRRDLRLFFEAGPGEVCRDSLHFVIAVRRPYQETRRIMREHRGECLGHDIGEFVLLDTVPHVEQECPARTQHTPHF